MKDTISYLLVVVLCTKGVLSSCPVGSTDFEGRCLVAGKNSVKFSHAYNYCLALSCNLAVPTAELRPTLLKFGTANSVTTNVFFGVTDSLLEGTFVKAPTGEVFSDAIWDTNKPSGSSSNNCLRVQDMNNWKMEDVSCSGSNKFFCDCGES